ncbi:hypothetical protein J2Z79_001792 [Symbiobacterium terraclitae]|uniref:SbsA Ig-like domain-containing protein n=1 Tax=Symbiobacterium terraclitae TaxID=557451 RepID=A0ABS4JS82_9FIRM|nr:hypothetical protein [Symbiobacterium terraclitae]MBP2018384.1 hypothetical protein [Symbiobacterium terraclitae]
MLPRRWLLTALSLVCVLAVGCSSGGRAQGETTGPGGTVGSEPAQAGDSSDTGSDGGGTTAGGAGGESAAVSVSSSISLVEYPWVKAPARVSAFSKQIRIQFSGPVDRGSVEARVAESVFNTPYTLEWSGDQEALLTLQAGCSSAELSMAGVKDAAGRELLPDRNPPLSLRLPCHGGAYRLVGAVDGLPIDGFPADIATIVDSDPAGSVLGRAGTIYFLFEAGEVRPVAYTQEGTWARLLRGGDLLIADGHTLRRVDRQGEVLKEITLPGSVIQGTVSPKGDAALLLLGSQQAVLVDLAQGSTRELATVAQSGDVTQLLWRRAANDVLAITESGPNWTPAWTLNLETGELSQPTGPLQLESPDGRWVIDFDRMGIFATDDPATPAVALSDEMLHPQWAPVWAPDSRHLVMGGGQVIDVATGTVLRSLADLQTCAPLRTLSVGLAGEELFVAYQDSCH